MAGGSELFELVRALLEKEERERKERALGRIRPWEVHDEATTALTSGMADAWPRHSLVGGDAQRVAKPSYRSDWPVMPVGPVEHGVLHMLTSFYSILWY